jgi:uncharacterized protein YjdB
VVKVDAEGRLTALRKGTATIRATAGGVTARCRVTVKRLPVRSLTLSRKKVTLLAGRDGYQFVSKTTPSNADNPAVTWSSSRPTVASVDPETGYVTPLKARHRHHPLPRRRRHPEKGLRHRGGQAVVPTALTLDSTSLEIQPRATAARDGTVSPPTSHRFAGEVGQQQPLRRVRFVGGGVVTGRKYGRATITAKTRSGSIRARCLVSVGQLHHHLPALVVGQET